MQKLSAPKYAVLFLALFFSLISSCAYSSKEEKPYPNRPINVIVPFAPGGGTDTFGRIIKSAVTEHDLLSQPLVIINTPGAGGTIGSRRVMNEKPDGYTVLLLHDAIMTAKHYGTVLYGPEAFEQVAATGRTGMVIGVHDNSPHNTLTDLLDAAAEKPNTVTFAANLGALSHFIGLLLEQKHGKAEFRFAQSGGGADRFAAIKGEHAAATAFSLDEFIRFKPDGIKALAYLGERRHEDVSEVATAIEQGFDIVQSNTYYWWMPKGSSPESVERLAFALQQAMISENVRERLRAMKIDPVFLTGEELQKYLEDKDATLTDLHSGTISPLPNIPYILLGLTLVSGAAVFVRRLSNKSATDSEINSYNINRWMIVAIGTLLVILYAVSTILLDFPLGLMTALFLLSMGLLLSFEVRKTKPRLRIGVIVVNSLVVGLLFHVIFTLLFEIGL